MLDTSGSSGDKENIGILYWMSTLHPVVQAIMGVMFLFTAWSFVTNFDLGGILNKYADASLEQGRMQFEAQLQLQTMQFEATKTSNQKLDTLIQSMELANLKMTEQAKQITALSSRMMNMELTVGRLAEWSCKHSGGESPAFCSALSDPQSHTTSTPQLSKD